MKRLLRTSLWLVTISLGILSACSGKEEAGDGDGDVGDGDGDGDVGDGDGDSTSSGGSMSSGGTSSGGNMTVEMTGSACETVDDCYPRVDPGELSGDAVCIDKVEDGYCSHECEMDEDCCAAEGECESDLEQVCAPFTNLDLMLCFLSCEDADVEGAGYEDPDEFCSTEANPDFVCRSTGGGQKNRRACIPDAPGMGGAGGMGGGGGMSPL